MSSDTSAVARMVSFGTLVTLLSKIFFILCHEGSYKVEPLSVNLCFVLTRQQCKEFGVVSAVIIHGGTEPQSIQSFGKCTIE